MPTDAHQLVLSMGSDTHGRHHPRHKQRRNWGRTLMVLVLAGGLIGGGLYAATNFIGLNQSMVRERCTAMVGGEKFTLSPDQAANAALISAVATKRGLTERAAQIGVATAMQESKLTNIDYGDDAGPDSRGLFQQRPSMGWGTQAQVMNPLYAANRFFQELETFDYASMALTDAAQKVQRSAYPLAYAKHESMAKAFASPLTGNADSALNCTLHPADTAGAPKATQTALKAATGISGATIDGPRLMVPVKGKQGWAVAQWAVANAQGQNIESVSYAGLLWNRAQGSWVRAATSDGFVVIQSAKP